MSRPKNEHGCVGCALILIFVLCAIAGAFEFAEWIYGIIGGGLFAG